MVGRGGGGPTPLRSVVNNGQPRNIVPTKTGQVPRLLFFGVVETKYSITDIDNALVGGNHGHTI